MKKYPGSRYPSDIRGRDFDINFEGIGYWALILLPVILVIYSLLVMAMGIEKDDLVIIKELWKKVQSTA